MTHFAAFPHILDSGRIPAVLIAAPLFLACPGFLILRPDLPFFCLTTGLTALFLTALILLWDPRRLLRTALPMLITLPLLLIVLLGLYHAFGHPFCTIQQLGFPLLLPAAALAAKCYAVPLKQLFPSVMTLLWLWNPLFFLVQHVFRGSEFGGVTGNRNWTSALIMTTAPFACLCAYRLLLRLRLAKRLSLILGIAVPTLISIFLLGWIASRGTLAAVVLTLLILPAVALPRPSWRRTARILLLLLLFLAAAAAVTLQTSRMQNDERLIIASGTLNMIADAPLLGHGSAFFETAYLPYRPQYYFLHPHCAVRTDHPHNEFLFQAAGNGLPGAVAWLMLFLIPLFLFARRFRESDLTAKLVFLSLLSLLIHAQFDLIFFQPPTNLLAFLLLGLCWAEVWPAPAATFDASPSVAPRLFWMTIRLAGLALLCLCVWAAIQHTGAEILLLRADRALTAGRPADARSLYLRVLPRTDNSAHLYRVLMRAAIDWRDPVLSKQIADRIQSSGDRPDYANVHAFAANAAVQLGDLRTAELQLLRQAEIFPLSVIPLVNLRAIYQAEKRFPECERISRLLNTVCQVQKITPRRLDFILRHPDFDLRPWEIPPEIH